LGTANFLKFPEQDNYPQKFSLPIKGPVSTIRTLGSAKLNFSKISTFQNREIKTQQKYNVYSIVLSLGADNHTV